MKPKFVVIVAIFICAFIFQGAHFTMALPVLQANDKTADKDAIPSAKQVPQTRTKTYRSAPGEESIYYIDIKEERAYNNFIARTFTAKYGDKNLRKILIDKGINLFPEPFLSYYIQAVEKAFRFPFIFFFIAIIFVLAGNVFSVIAILFVTNLIMNIRSKKRKGLRDHYEQILTNLMLQVIDKKEAILQLSKFKRKKNLLIEVMMDFQKSFRGDADRIIIDLYQEMDLGKTSYDKTFAISFFNQVIGIRELTNMHPYHATEMIATRLNDQNDIVRTEAQICYPQVNKEFPFDFLSILEQPFSKWAQLNIYYYIKIHELPVPSFDKWLQSDQQNVVIFCIQMISLFQQQENSNEIIHLLNDPNEFIRFEAIKTCGELNIFESKQILKESFRTETLNNKVAITKSFSYIGEDTDLAFLEGIARSKEISLRLEACRTMYQLGEKSRDYLQNLNQSMNFVLTAFIAHIKDPRN